MVEGHDFGSGKQNNLKGKHDEMERKLQEREKELEDGIMTLVSQSGEQAIVQAMSQVILKNLELIGLRKQNKVLENLVVQKEQERKGQEAKSQAWEEKCQELKTNNDNLTNQVTCQPHVQGEKHIIWYAIIE